MPTYTVSAPAALLSAAQKQAIAREVTRVHAEATGAPAFFAQVVFVDVEAGCWFMGGVPMTEAQVFLQGQIRGGRTAGTRQRLVTGLRDALAAATGLATSRVWCYLVELPPSNMLEYGHVLPEPGGEAAWLAALPDQDRALMQSIGR